MKVSVLISVRLQDCIRRDKVRNECPLVVAAWLAEMPMLFFSSWDNGQVPLIIPPCLPT